MIQNVRRFRGLDVGRSTKNLTKFLFLPIIYNGYFIWLEFVNIEYSLVWKDRYLFGGSKKVWMITELSFL